MDIHERKRWFELSRKKLKDILDDTDGELSEDIISSAKSSMGRRDHGIARIERQLHNENGHGAHI
jgi:hypothetical protein